MSGLSMRTNTINNRNNDQKQENHAPRFCLQYKNKPLSYLHNHYFDPIIFNSHTQRTTNSPDFDLIEAIVMEDETAHYFPQSTNITHCKTYNEEMDDLICSIVRFHAKYPGNSGDQLPSNHPDRIELDRRKAALKVAKRLLKKTHELSRHFDNEIQKETKWMESIGMVGEKSVAQIDFEYLKQSCVQIGNDELVPTGCAFGSIGDPVRRSEPRSSTPIISAAMVPSSPKRSPPRHKNGKPKHSMCCSFCYGTHKDQCTAQGVAPLDKDYPGAWSTHPAKENGDVVCPVLYKIRCEICGATREKAHTTKFHLAHPEKCT